MEWYFTLCGAALLGIQTAMSPCPLTTNIAAIAYIGRRAGRSCDVWFSGILYAAGQMSAYSVLAFCVLVIPFFSGDQLTRFFTATLHTLLGPILILVGMTFTGLIQFSLPGMNGETMRKTADRFGLWSAFPLGILFALAFCPTTAATFLAMLALAGSAKSVILCPLVFGLGSALPVLVFAGVLTFQSQNLNRIFQTVSGIDRWLQKIVGVTFIGLGIFLSLQ
jgi:cytochrome c biogenesis protein CcdA